MTVFDELRRVAPAQTGRTGADVDWPGVEDRLGLRLPDDYKWLVETYGPGSFDDFLRVFQPGYPQQVLDLEHQRERTNWAMDYLRERGHAIPYENDELLAVARSDNGDTAYWVLRPSNEPNKWTIALNEGRGPKWDTFDGGIVAWLAAILSKRVRMDVFPRDFPSRRPKFHVFGR
ncbi:SMI1/KNR4 family protein [Plantactinospora sp. KLBMP9567]|uniref:SMI1/KNR4 family protein n=1 Tax=Plantactinospora sp. KLBMP9567 TaxID=3085900 RepID=UPI00298209B6|nr:SMI1/KNR4 family protein [Plantactinospora sp. KLBMP9567]MDW5327413.1 hypothetical protein [Plantactinospora sp. KLBMP9567]